MSQFIDRRLNGKDKSVVNRRRFIKRYKADVREAVRQAVNQRSIQNTRSGQTVHISRKRTDEPRLRHQNDGVHHRVFTGNTAFVTGDRIKRPPGGAGGGGNGPNASRDGESVDDFEFQLSQREFREFLFEELELPNLAKKRIRDFTEWETRRAGYSSDGSPSQINVVKSMQKSLARRIALRSARKRQCEELVRQLLEFDGEVEQDHRKRQAILEKLDSLRAGNRSVPFLTEYDIRYNRLDKFPVPVTAAVMFCVMDVSGSMDQETKNIAKRFFLLLYLFLSRHYEKTEVVFIRHHSTAKEVDEHTFFHSRESGGTVVSSALNLMDEIIRERYPSSQWNIYGAQASDGDNWEDDSGYCARILTESLLPRVQFYSYIEISRSQAKELWKSYAGMSEQFDNKFSMKQITGANEIFPVFRDLFKRRECA